MRRLVAVKAGAAAAAGLLSSTHSAIAFVGLQSAGKWGSTRRPMTEMAGAPKDVKKYQYDYPQCALTVDCVPFALSPKREWLVLLIERGNDPFKGQWALAGGFVNEQEDLEVAARRELEEETALSVHTPLAQIGAYGAPHRDPRQWCTTVAFMSVQEDVHAGGTATAGDDAAKAEWFPLSALPSMAFDHADIVEDACKRLQIEQGSGQDAKVVDRASGVVMLSVTAEGGLQAPLAQLRQHGESK